MKLLLAGFEPFGGCTVNPSEQVVRALAQESLPGVELHTAILPVDRTNGPAAVLRAVQEIQPDVVLCLGESSGRMAISIERVAINLMDYRIADNAGNQSQDEPIVPDGPAAYFVTLPIRAILEAIKAAHVPAELSLSAAAFLCNQVLYTLLHHLALNRPGVRAGLVHVPPLPEQVVNKDRLIAPMGLDIVLTGIRAAISAIANGS